jgi:NADP-dependent 3-hydroxy acid dehydrogenase YdfG
MKLFSGQAAVITGASSGIGRATALALAANGATVCLVSRRLSALQKVAEEAGPDGCCRCYQADLVQQGEVERLGSELERDCKHVDILVHNAGAISLGDLSRQSAEDFDRQYRVNVRAPFALTQHLLPKLKATRGQIVFLNSTAALRPGLKAGQYAATHASLRALADSLRDEVNGDGVRVLSVFVGRTATPMQAAVHQFEGKQYRPDLLMQPEDVASVIVSALALARSAEVTEITVRPMRKS